jgi:prepilin-type N-terminal cleavage/methylation domain-containing protein
MNRFGKKRLANRQPGQQVRRGYTLIELVVVISMTSVLLVVVVGWLHQSLKFGSSMRERQRNHRSLTELAWQLRDDVRQSESIAVEDNNRLVIKSLGGNTTSYTLSNSKSVVERKENGSSNQQSQFELSDSSVAHWDTSEMPDWISLVVSKQPDGKFSPANQATTNKDSKSNTMPGDPILTHEEHQKPIDLHVRVGPNRWTGITKAEGQE